MNIDVILGLVRHVLTFGGGVLVSRGIVDVALVEQLIGAIVTLMGGLWSVLHKQQLK